MISFNQLSEWKGQAMTVTRKEFFEAYCNASDDDPDDWGTQTLDQEYRKFQEAPCLYLTYRADGEKLFRALFPDSQVNGQDKSMRETISDLIAWMKGQVCCPPGKGFDTCLENHMDDGVCADCWNEMERRFQS